CSTKDPPGGGVPGRCPPPARPRAPAWDEGVRTPTRDEAPLAHGPVSHRLPGERVSRFRRTEEVRLVTAARRPHFRTPRRRKGSSMLKWFATAAQCLREEDGPTAVEYAVMLALIIVVCITAITTLGTNASSTFSNVALNAAAGAKGS